MKTKTKDWKIIVLKGWSEVRIYSELQLKFQINKILI